MLHKSEYLPGTVGYEHFLDMKKRSFFRAVKETPLDTKDTGQAKHYTSEACIRLLQLKAEELNAKGEQRYPKRSDFSDSEVNSIKAYLGPWPRALEAAGLKPERDDDHRQKLLDKRIRAKRRRIAALKSKGD